LRLPEELHAVDSDLADTVQRLVGKAEITAANNPALNEVDRASYDRIITEWKTAHRRRRNLWTEMANLKLPGLDR
jgi:hypothetical protein